MRLASLLNRTTHGLTLIDDVQPHTASLRTANSLDSKFAEVGVFSQSNIENWIN